MRFAPGASEKPLGSNVGGVSVMVVCPVLSRPGLDRTDPNHAGRVVCLRDVSDSGRVSALLSRRRSPQQENTEAIVVRAAKDSKSADRPSRGTSDRRSYDLPYV